jgi:hypothetical protein
LGSAFFINKKYKFSGIVFRAVKKDGTVLFEGASGVKGLNHKDQPVTTDTLFWVASCTKVARKAKRKTQGNGGDRGF